MVGWGVAGGEGWLVKGGRLEHQRGTNHGGWGGLADGKPRAQDGKSPLHSAARHGNEAIAGALLKAGVDKDAKDKVKGGGVQGESGAVRCGLE